MHLKIVSATKKVLDVDGVRQVNVPCIDGLKGILPHHINLISLLDIGILEYFIKKEKNLVSLNGGVVVVEDDTVLIISDNAALSKDVLKSEIEKSINSVEKKLKRTEDVNDIVELEKQLKYEHIRKIMKNKDKV